MFAEGPVAVEQPLFWSDQLAYAVTQKFPEKDTYVVASGITPSGHVHIGNFREIITTDFVYKSLKNYGKDAKFIYSWDDYDRFRKVPEEVPDSYEQYIGLPVSEVPDPEGCHESYAAHFEAELEKSLEDMHLDVEFIRQSEMFQKGKYSSLIRDAMNSRDTIKDILDQYRSEDLEDDWQPLRVYCRECGKDFTEVKDYNGEFTVTYFCEECGEEFEINFEENDSVKPPWRVDWPMRWVYEDVSFEPGGKDHSAAGSSRDTGEEIIREVWGEEPPVYQMYDFVRLKGSDKKISSSSGEDVMTLEDMKEVYSPEMVRFLFSQSKPRSVIELAFGEEAIQVFDRFDRIESHYFNPEDLENEKKRRHQERVYELAMVEMPEQEPVRVPFKHASFVAQTVPEKEWRTRGIESLQRTGHLPEDISGQNVERTMERMRRAKNWAREYAPEKYVYRINTDAEGTEQLEENQVEALELLLQALEDSPDEEKIDERMWDVRDESELETGEFFETCYTALLGKDSGPRLSTLIASLGTSKTQSILSEVIEKAET